MEGSGAIEDMPRPAICVWGVLLDPDSTDWELRCHVGDWPAARIEVGANNQIRRVVLGEDCSGDDGQEVELVNGDEPFPDIDAAKAAVEAALRLTSAE